jgi:hypothetical protein
LHRAVNPQHHSPFFNVFRSKGPIIRFQELLSCSTAARARKRKICFSAQMLGPLWQMPPRVPAKPIARGASSLAASTLSVALLYGFVIIAKGYANRMKEIQHSFAAIL